MCSAKSCYNAITHCPTRIQRAEAEGSVVALPGAATRLVHNAKRGPIAAQISVTSFQLAVAKALSGRTSSTFLPKNSNTRPHCQAGEHRKHTHFA